MSQLSRARPRARVLSIFTLALGAVSVVGLGACTSSGARGDTTAPQPNVKIAATDETVVTEPVVTQPGVTATTAAALAAVADTLPTATSVQAASSTTAASPQAGTDAVVLTEAEVAEFEQQLDEIDQLLTGVNADLSQD
ncbi:MAG: hypothetical protein ABI894_11545 [Ilumatobacteraceae bacterium]